VPPFDAKHGCKQRSRGTRIIKVDGILVRQTGALVDEVGHLGTPVAGAQATALTAENAEKKMPK